jgi:hypothetical protein
MLTANVLLLIISLLGAFDVFYFHRRRCGLSRRPESRTEALLHMVRGAVYVLQLAAVPNLRFGGACYALFGALFVVDVAVAIADVAVEPKSRRGLGGLPDGEYLMHIVLSVLVGAYLHALATGTAGWWRLPTAVTVVPAAPGWLRAVLGLVGAGCAAVTLLELLEMVEARLARPLPVHVAIRLRAPLPEVWRVTQDHVRHPTWDHRFSRIVMLDDDVHTGTTMRYEKRLLPGIVIRGFGRYKLLSPLRQSTFEFWSDDRRSLIHRGVGLWRYRAVAPGITEFRTSYTYEVRWGVLGRVIDRWLYRPLIQRETERSFARLARLWFPGVAASAVAGRRGRRPAPLAAAAAVAVAVAVAVKGALA